MSFKSWDELTELEQASCEFWDMYKAAYGIRPRHVDTSSWKLEQFHEEFKILGAVIEAEEKARIAAEAQAVVVFEKRIADLISSGAADRETALRWIHEAEGSDGDDDYLCFLVGIPYGYIKQIA